MSLSITQFLHNFSKPNITPEESFGLMNEFQRSINLLIEQNDWKQKIIDRLQNETLNQKTYIERYNTTLVLLQQANERNTQYRRELEELKRNIPTYNPELKTEKPTVEDLKKVYKQLRGHKASIESGKADVVIIDDMQHSEVYKQVEKLTEELKRERQDMLALKGEFNRLEKVMHKERADNLEWRGRCDALEQQLKKTNDEVTEYRREVQHLQEHNTMITALYNNQNETIKRQVQTINHTKKILTTLDEVISESDA